MEARSSFNRMLSTLAMILPQTSPPSNGNIDPVLIYTSLETVFLSQKEWTEVCRIQNENTMEKNKLDCKWVTVAMALLASGMLAHGDEPIQLLPKEIAGWSAAGEDRIFTRDTIFDYMDGAGEIYLAYDFQRLFVREYTREAAPPVVAEVYQMASSEDAYGIFSHDMDGKEVPIGQGAIYAMGLLRFWKDRIFVRILVEKETEETKEAVLALGRKIADAIPKEGKKPELVACLPAEGLLRQTVHYFHKQVILNSHYFLADVNLLNLSEKTQALLARYQKDGRKVRLLLCRHPTPEEAKAAFERFCKIYFADKPARKSLFRVEKVERGELVSARWMERLVILVFEAKDRKTCEWLTEAVVRKAKELRSKAVTVIGTTD